MYASLEMSGGVFEPRQRCATLSASRLSVSLCLFVSLSLLVLLQTTKDKTPTTTARTRGLQYSLDSPYISLLWGLLRVPMGIKALVLRDSNERDMFFYLNNNTSTDAGTAVCFPLHREGYLHDYLFCHR